MYFFSFSSQPCRREPCHLFVLVTARFSRILIVTADFSNNVLNLALVLVCDIRMRLRCPNAFRLCVDIRCVNPTQDVC